MSKPRLLAQFLESRPEIDFLLVLRFTIAIERRSVAFGRAILQLRPAGCEILAAEDAKGLTTEPMLPINCSPQASTSAQKGAWDGPRGRGGKPTLDACCCRTSVRCSRLCGFAATSALRGCGDCIAGFPYPMMSSSREERRESDYAHDDSRTRMAKRKKIRSIAIDWRTLD